jgi:hypothetical protein
LKPLAATACGLRRGHQLGPSRQPVAPYIAATDLRTAAACAMGNGGGTAAGLGANKWGRVGSIPLLDTYDGISDVMFGLQTNTGGAFLEICASLTKKWQGPSLGGVEPSK